MTEGQQQVGKGSETCYDIRFGDGGADKTTAKAGGGGGRVKDFHYKWSERTGLYLTDSSG